MHPCGRRHEPGWAQVIDGEDEGIYGWAALNYHRGALGSAGGSQSHSSSGSHGDGGSQGTGSEGSGHTSGHHHHIQHHQGLRDQMVTGGAALVHHSFGTLDLGGSSLEVGSGGVLHVHGEARMPCFAMLWEVSSLPVYTALIITMFP